jgi:starch phosphorylase
VWQAHVAAKQQLLTYVSSTAHIDLNPEVLTIGFARRATAYKRADLIFRDMERLRAIAKTAGPIQIIFGGKAHPQDVEGKELIKRIFSAKERLRDLVKIVYLENYDIMVAKMMTAGVDVWLNTPQPPLEASGTSGMKAALNGVPSLSVLDGWWLEGCLEGLTGWAIGEMNNSHDTNHAIPDEVSLYDQLEKEIIPLFYKRRDEFLTIMLHCIALNGSFFNAQRMMQQYVLKAYFP